MSYKLSNNAEYDLRRNYRYTLLKFDDQHAATYLIGLDETLEKISSNPAIAQKIDDIRTNYRRYLYHEHAVSFLEKESFIYVVRVLHQQMKVSLHLD